MPIANYSTDVPAVRTIGQIAGMLVTHGASNVTQHIADGQVIGIEFGIDTEFGWRPYRLPVRIEGVHLALNRDPAVSPRQRTEAHAARVAWRIAHDWLRINLALIDAGMASLPEVMFPYTLVNGQQTAFELYAKKELEK